MAHYVRRVKPLEFRFCFKPQKKGRFSDLKAQLSEDKLLRLGLEK